MSGAFQDTPKHPSAPPKGAEGHHALEMPRAEVHVDILLTEGFVLTELASIVEILRISNRITTKPLFSWSYLSKKGGPIGCRAGLSAPTIPFRTRPDADYAFFLGNSDPGCPDLSMKSVISSYCFRGSKVLILSEAASRYIAEAGDQDVQHTTHWENRALLNERGTVGEGSYALVVDDGKIMTCAGMGATVDVALEVVGRHISSATKRTVADIMLHERIRDFSTPQPFSGTAGTNTGDRILDQCIDLMQANIEDPLPISELVENLQISSRSLERKFRAFLDATPNTYYRELRLNHASNLLMNTTMSVRDVGIACGFPNGFSSLYKSFFGITPHALRKKRRKGS